MMIDCLLQFGVMTWQICPALCWGQLECDRWCRNCSGVSTVAGIATSRQRWVIDQLNKLVLCRSELPHLCSDCTNHIRCSHSDTQFELKTEENSAEYEWVCMHYLLPRQVWLFTFIVNKCYIHLHKLVCVRSNWWGVTSLLFKALNEAQRNEQWSASSVNTSAFLT